MPPQSRGSHCGRVPAPQGDASTYRDREHSSSASWQEVDSRSRAGSDDERFPGWELSSASHDGSQHHHNSSSRQYESDPDMDSDGDGGLDGSCGEAGTLADQSTGTGGAKARGQGIHFSNQLPPLKRRSVAVAPAGALPRQRERKASRHAGDESSSKPPRQQPLRRQHQEEGAALEHLGGFGGALLTDPSDSCRGMRSDNNRDASWLPEAQLSDMSDTQASASNAKGLMGESHRQPDSLTRGSTSRDRQTRSSRSRDHRTRGSSVTEGLHSVVGGGDLSPCQAVEDFRKAVQEIERQHGWDQLSDSP